MKKIIGTLNQNFEILKEEVYKESVLGYRYSIVLAKNIYCENNWVTWDSIIYEDENHKPEYFWGHYTSEKENALEDYYQRILLRIKNQ